MLPGGVRVLVGPRSSNSVFAVQSGSQASLPGRLRLAAVVNLALRAGPPHRPVLYQPRGVEAVAAEVSAGSWRTELPPGPPGVADHGIVNRSSWPNGDSSDRRSYRSRCRFVTGRVQPGAVAPHPRRSDQGEPEMSAPILDETATNQPMPAPRRRRRSALTLLRLSNETTVTRRARRLALACLAVAAAATLAGCQRGDTTVNATPTARSRHQPAPWPQPLPPRRPPL
jgi:hypothetical protein